MEERNRVDQLGLSGQAAAARLQSFDKSPGGSSAFPSTPLVPAMIPSLEAYIEAYRSLMAQDAVTLSAVGNTAAAGFPIRPHAVPMPVMSPGQLIASPYFGLSPFSAVDFARYGLMSPVFLPPFLGSMYCRGSNDPSASPIPPLTTDHQRPLPSKDLDSMSLGSSYTNPPKPVVPVSHQSDRKIQNKFSASVTSTTSSSARSHSVTRPNSDLPKPFQSHPTPHSTTTSNNVKNHHHKPTATIEHRSTSSMEIPIEKKPIIVDTTHNGNFRASAVISPKMAPIDFSKSMMATNRSHGQVKHSPNLKEQTTAVKANNKPNSVSNHQQNQPTVAAFDPRSVTSQPANFSSYVSPPVKQQKMTSQVPVPPKQSPLPPPVNHTAKIPSGIPCEKISVSFDANLSKLPLKTEINPHRPHTVDHPPVVTPTSHSPALNYSIRAAADSVSTPKAPATIVSPSATGIPHKRNSSGSRPNRKRSHDSTAPSGNGTEPEPVDGKTKAAATGNSIGGVEEFRCRLCNYSGRSQHCLSKHYRAHDLAYKICRYCRRAFERPSDLLRHEERHRRRDIPGAVPLNGSNSPTDLSPSVIVDSSGGRCMKIGRIESYTNGVVSSSSLVAIRLGSGDNEIVLDFEAPAADAFLEGHIPPEPSKLRDVYSIMAGIVVAQPAAIFAMNPSQMVISSGLLAGSTGINGKQLVEEKKPQIQTSLQNIAKGTVSVSGGAVIDGEKDEFMKSFELRNVHSLTRCGTLENLGHEKRSGAEKKSGGVPAWVANVSVCDWMAMKEAARRKRRHARHQRRKQRRNNAASATQNNNSLPAGNTEPEKLERPVLNGKECDDEKPTDIVKMETTSGNKASLTLSESQSKADDIPATAVGSSRMVTSSSKLALVAASGPEDVPTSGDEKSVASILTCARCRYSTSSAFKYEQHVKAHGGRFICKACGKACIKASDLFRHWSTHGTRGADGHFACDSCSYTSPQRVTVEHHMRVHYIPQGLLTARHAATSRCGLCGKLVPRTRIYEHKRAVHGFFFKKSPPGFHCGLKTDANGNAVVASKRFRCRYCQQRFATPSHLLRHQFARHRHDGFATVTTKLHSSKSTDKQADNEGRVSVLVDRSMLEMVGQGLEHSPAPTAQISACVVESL